MLTNAPAYFENFINETLTAFLDRYVTAYLNDILIYSETLDKYQIHMRGVLKTLLRAGQYQKPKQFEFHEEEVKYLGLIIRREVVKMDLYEVAAVCNWPEPQSTFDF